MGQSNRPFWSVNISPKEPAERRLRCDYGNKDGPTMDHVSDGSRSSCRPITRVGLEPGTSDALTSAPSCHILPKGPAVRR